MRQGRALLSLADHCCCPVAASAVRRNDLTARAHGTIAQRVQCLPVWRRDGRHRACEEALCAGRPICALWLSTEATSAGGRSPALAGGNPGAGAPGQRARWAERPRPTQAWPMEWTRAHLLVREQAHGRRLHVPGAIEREATAPLSNPLGGGAGKPLQNDDSQVAASVR
jgi:hypothetical protein